PAEDGIRDFHVTGVQTCALPIFRAVTTQQQPGPAPSALLQPAASRSPGVSAPLKEKSAPNPKDSARFLTDSRSLRPLAYQAISTDRKSVVEGERAHAGRRRRVLV